MNYSIIKQKNCYWNIPDFQLKVLLPSCGSCSVVGLDEVSSGSVRVVRSHNSGVNSVRSFGENFNFGNWIIAGNKSEWSHSPLYLILCTTKMCQNKRSSICFSQPILEIFLEIRIFYAAITFTSYLATEKGTSIVSPAISLGRFIFSLKLLRLLAPDVLDFDILNEPPVATFTLLATRLPNLLTMIGSLSRYYIAL